MEEEGGEVSTSRLKLVYFRIFLEKLLFGVTLAEFVNATGRIDQPLRARIERVAIRANFKANFLDR